MNFRKNTAVTTSSLHPRPRKLSARQLSSLQPRHIVSDARDLTRYLPVGSVDLIVTSPPYWNKRNYGHDAQLGREKTPGEFAQNLADVMDSWRPFLKPTSSVFINLGDSMRAGCMAGIPTIFEMDAVARGWNLVSRILWVKKNGMPDPHDRLAQRHESIFQFALRAAPFIDTYAYSEHFSLAQGNVWHIALRPTKSAHLAPFPEELPRRAISLACPERVCFACGTPMARQTQRGLQLDTRRAQARRALEIWQQSGLGEKHLEAIRATGICDAGKSLRFQNGAGGNSAEVTRLAREAKTVLGGYFREFTFALPEQRGWSECACGSNGFQPGLVVDPFAGTGTTSRAARALGRRSLGSDLFPIDEAMS